MPQYNLPWLRSILYFFPLIKLPSWNQKDTWLRRRNLARMPKAIQQCYWKCTLLRLFMSMLCLRFNLKALNYLVRKCILWPDLTLISNNSYVDHYRAGTKERKSVSNTNKILSTRPRTASSVLENFQMEVWMKPKERVRGQVLVNWKTICQNKTHS